MSNTERIIVGISGASGALLGIRLLEYLKDTDIETHLVLSKAAEMTVKQETDWEISDVLNLANYSYQIEDTGSAIASGSFACKGMVVIPCSIKTMSSIANSFDADLITRAADVTMKEGRPLILAVREAPLHSGHINLMALASQAGAIIFPPVPAFYVKPTNLNDIVDNIVGRILVRMGIENNLYLRWKFQDYPDSE